MRKFLTAAVVAVIAVAGMSVLATADEGPQGTSWDFKFTSGKKARAVGSNSIVEPSKLDDKGTEDTSDDRYAPTHRTVVVFPRGSSIDTGALPSCKKSPSDVQTGKAKCPSNTKIGAGVANAVAGQNADSKGTEIVSLLEAWNRKNEILFAVKPCKPGTGPGTGASCDLVPGGTQVLLGKWSKITTRPTLTVPTPPNLLTAGIIITRFQLKTAKKTRKTTVNGRTVIRSYAITPKRCTGRWASSASMRYGDGSTITVPDKQPCSR